jgi:integrase
VPNAANEIVSGGHDQFPDRIPSHLPGLPSGRRRRRAGSAFGPSSDTRLLRRQPNTRNWADSYRSACAAVGITGRTRTHDLRHVAASALISSGLSVAAVQAVLGHASPAETLEVYTHFWPADEERTRSAIEAAAQAWNEAASPEPESAVVDKCGERARIGRLL